MKKSLLFLLALSSIGFMCSKDKTLDSGKSTRVVISIEFSGPEYQGDFYTGYLPPTDYAAWIENDGGYVKTLEITPVAVTVDTVHGSHIEHLPHWMEAAGVTYDSLARTTENGVSPLYDGLTSASPTFSGDSRILTLEWDLTADDGSVVEPGVYYISFEAGNIIKGADEVVLIISETTRASLNTEIETVTDAVPTENILRITAEFVEN